MRISPGPVIIAVIVGSIIIAAIISYLQRTTTDTESKYLGKSSTELDATFYYNFQNTTWGDWGIIYPSGTPAIPEGNDPDRDGLTNIQEKQLGTHPRDPDTDNDFISDGVESLTGTDPLVSDLLALVIPIKPIPGIGVPLPPPIIQYDQLFINSLQKKVKNLGNPTEDWSLVANAKFGEKVAFKIDAELTNPSSDQTFSATFSDQLGKNLQYVSKSGYIKIGQGTPQELPDDWLVGYAVAISPEISMQKPVPVEITFQVLLVDNSTDRYHTTINRVWLKTPGDLQAASAFIIITSLI